MGRGYTSWRRWRLQSGQGVRVRMRGHVYVNFASDDYLDLAADPRLARAAARAANRYGCGAGASHLFSGDLPPHRALERLIAAREGCDATMVFESSLTGSLVLLDLLAGPKDVIFCDARNSAALVDACNLPGCEVYQYRHRDIDRLESLLRGKGASHARRLIVTETVFGLDGSLAPLADIVRLAETCDAFILVDEAYAAGIFGSRGLGLADDLSPEATGQHRILKSGSLGKAFGSQGGYICGPRKLLSAAARYSRFVSASGALAVPAAAAARCGLLLSDREPDRRRRVTALADRLRWLLQANGISFGSSRSQIVSIVVGRAETAITLSRRLEIMGLLVPPMLPPLVSKGHARLRISLTAGHTDGDVDRLVNSLIEARAAIAV